jgi:alpha-1,3-glucosyltransferase
MCRLASPSSTSFVSIFERLYIHLLFNSLVIIFNFDLTRLFFVDIGIFEDKVANIWYLLSVGINVRVLASQETLVKLSSLLTLALISPIAYNLLRYPLNVRRMILSLSACSLAFFLASFQVHEKSILLCSVPLSVYLLDDTLFVSWFQIVASFTMYPLLKRDGQSIPYIATSVAYFAVVYWLEYRKTQSDRGTH